MTKDEREALLKQKLENMLTYERALWADGVSWVGGVDEVGRGPLAGPVCAACVVLPHDFSVLGVNDSKKLSEKKRNELYGLLVECAPAYGIGLVGNARIDEVNILNATKEAMVMAVAAAGQMLAENLADTDALSDTPASTAAAATTDAELSANAPSRSIGHLLVDAVKLPEAKLPGTAIVKGDEKSVSIAAASIIAKVTRDQIMTELESAFPGYGFARNKGYGTAEHMAALRRLGPTPIHRRSFLKSL